MSDIYDQDGLSSVHDHEFMSEPEFKRAYARGVQAVGGDYAWHWRVHTGMWAATTAANLPGDFVECGVNRGFMSSAVMALLDWDTQGRTFFLLDTFCGVDERFLSEEDRLNGVSERNTRDIESGFYSFDVEAIRLNFAEWKNTRIIVGAIPETLPEVTSDRVAFLHLDLNCSLPEVAAADFFWDKLVPGAVILLDDYGYIGYRSQKIGMDEFAKRRSVSILSLPTGQGLMVKPGSDRRLIEL